MFIDIWIGLLWENLAKEAVTSHTFMASQSEMEIFWSVTQEQLRKRNFVNLAMDLNIRR